MADTTERIRDLFTWATAWSTVGSHLESLRASNRAEFDAWLLEHDAEVRKNTLEAAKLERESKTGRFTITEDEKARLEMYDKLIAESDTLVEALGEIADKYHAAVTNNEPRWQDDVWLQEIGSYLTDTLNVIARFTPSAPVE